MPIVSVVCVTAGVLHVRASVMISRACIMQLVGALFFFFLDPRDDQAESRGNKCNESTY